MPEATLQRFAPDTTIGELSAKQLRDAIAAVTRGSELDAVRAQIVARAEKLDVGGLLPDNWRSDGSLASSTATWSTDEQRETWADLHAGLAAALDEKYSLIEDHWYYVWVQDFTDTDVIYTTGGNLYSAPYTVTDGPIEIGDPVKVRPVTQYVTTERAAAGPLREWRKSKVEGLKSTLERRTFATDDMQLRESDDGTLRLTGYASVTGVPYDVGWYQETIERGAFKRTLGEAPDVQLLINHTGMPLARTRSGTLTLSEDDRGLKVVADLDPEDPDVQSLARKMNRGDIDQMSFAFQATASDWNEDYTARSISAVSIHRGDVSVVNQGANAASTATLRSQEAIATLHRVGPDAFVAALAEWRDYTNLPAEKRADNPLSAATMEVLSQVSNLVAVGDDSLGEARSLLAEMMGVPDPPQASTDEPVQRTATPLPNHSRRAREILAAHRGGR